MHERSFKASTTYPFDCMMFQLCTSAGVTIWHIDVLCTPSGSVDIGPIRDEANKIAPRKGTKVEVPPLGENLEDTVKQAQGDDNATSETTDTSPVESTSNTSREPSSSWSMPPFSALVPLIKVQ